MENNQDSGLVKNLSWACAGIIALLGVSTMLMESTSKPVPRLEIYDHGKVVMTITDPNRIDEYLAAQRPSTMPTQPTSSYSSKVK